MKSKYILFISRLHEYILYWNGSQNNRELVKEKENFYIGTNIKILYGSQKYFVLRNPTWG